MFNLHASGWQIKTRLGAGLPLPLGLAYMSALFCHVMSLTHLQKNKFCMFKGRWCAPFFVFFLVLATCLAVQGEGSVVCAHSELLPHCVLLLTRYSCWNNASNHRHCVTVKGAHPQPRTRRSRPSVNAFAANTAQLAHNTGQYLHTRLILLRLTPLGRPPPPLRRWSPLPRTWIQKSVINLKAPTLELGTSSLGPIISLPIVTPWTSLFFRHQNVFHS